nr:TNF-alpha induced protein 3 [Mylopharyngodon piceus]
MGGRRVRWEVYISRALPISDRDLPISDRDRRRARLVNRQIAWRRHPRCFDLHRRHRDRSSLRTLAFKLKLGTPATMSQGQNFLPKFLFVSNLLKAVKIRERVPNDVVKPSASSGLIHHLRSMHRYTLEMIRMSQFPQAFREVIQAAILDRAMQSSLEQEKRLNWCREVKKLVPLRTNGDGNCLLHAASQYLLGVQDTDLVLRKALYAVLKETDTSNFRTRFQTELLHSQEFTQTGLRYSTLNWEEEWVKIVEMASPVSSSNGLQFDSLEDIHIFVLSNILRRPIIVIADQVLRSMKSGSSFSPLNVGGIYLPLHWPPGECYKYPIVLGYDSQHFAPLITIKDSGPEIRCATPRCTFYVSVDTQPHCHECFEKRQAGRKPEAISSTNQTSSSDPESRGRLERSVMPSPRSAPPTAPSLSLYSETHAMKCKTPGCLFTLSVEHDGLCERCFTARQNRSTANGPTQGPSHGWRHGQWVPGGREREKERERERERDTERCVMCRQEVFRIFNGLCPPCMQRTAVSERGDAQQQEPRTEASLWALHRETERTGTTGHTWQTPAARQCKRSGCQFFGTPEKLGFCTICYLDYQTNHQATPAIVQPRHTSEAGFQNCPRCRGQGCGAEGKAMLEGYCNKCFVKEQSARLNQAASRGSHSPPLVTRASKPRPPPMLTQAQCRRSGCKNLSPGCTDLCPDCLSRGQREGRRAQAPKEKSKQRCKTQGCDHYANQEKQGYCNECDHFKQIYRGPLEYPYDVPDYASL